MLGTASACAQTVVWNFSAGTGTPASLPTNITGGAITATNLSGTGSLAFNSTSGSTGYTGASGGNNAAVAARTGALSTSTSSYFEFTLAPATGHALSATSLTLGTRSTSTGPSTLTLYSSVDGFTTALGSASASTNSTWSSVTLTSFSVTAATDTNVTFRLFGSGGSGTVSGANWRIDDLSLSASASAIPEPSTYALTIGAAALGAAAWQRRRKNRTFGAAANTRS